MTKAELIEKLASYPDTADITVVTADGTVNDLAQIYIAQAQEGFRNNDEVFIYIHQGRV